MSTAPNQDCGYEEMLAKGRALRWRRKLRSAESHYRRAIALAPRKPQAYLYLAEALMRARDLKRMHRAIESGLQATVGLDSSNLNDYLDRYRLSLCGLNFPEAARIGEQVLSMTRRPEHLERLFWPIFCNEFEYAPRPVAYVQRAVRLSSLYLAGHPRSPWGFYFRGLMGELLPRPPETVVGDLEKVRSFSSTRYGWMSYKSGLRHFQSREFAKAAERFRVAAAASEPGSWKAQCCRCECWLRLADVGKARGALRDLDRIVSKLDKDRTDNRDSLTYQGRLHLWMGSTRRAEKILTDAVKLGSHLAPAWLGAALVRQERFEEALPILKKAAAHPFSVSKEEAMGWECEALYRMERHSELARGAARLLETDRRSVLGRAYRALVQRGLGREPQFRKEASRLVAEVSGEGRSAGARDLLASLERMLGAERLRFSQFGFDEMKWQEDLNDGSGA